MRRGARPRARRRRLMGPREVTCRLIQICRRRWRQVGFEIGNRRRRDGREAVRPRPGPDVWTAPRMRLAPGSVDIDARLAELGRAGSEWVDQWRAEAEAMMNGRFCLLGHERVAWGSPPDWGREPIRGRVFGANRFCWRIDPLDEMTYGDAKLVWELHRLQWLVRAALAWRATDDRQIGEWVGLCVDDWLNRVPAWGGIAWSSALEVALRGFSLAWLLALAGDRWSERCPRRVARLGAVLTASRQHVSENLSWFFAPNTHLLGELAWLACSGWIWQPVADRGLRSGSGWCAYRALVAEAALQTLPDGAHYEQSTCYHRYALELYLQTLLTARASGHSVPEIERVARLLLAAAECLAGDDGWPPALGDDDGGRLWPWLPGPAMRWDWSGLLDLGRRLGLGREARRGGLGGIESFILLGSSPPCPGTGEAAESPPAASSPGRATVQVLPAAGWVVLQLNREGEGPDEVRVAADFGRVGPHRTRAGHGHEDVGSFEVRLGAERWVVDRGTGDYLASGRRRQYRGAASHNVIDWPSFPQAAGQRLFVRESWVEGRIVIADAAGAAAWVAGRWALPEAAGWGVRVLVLLRGPTLLGLDAICHEQAREAEGTWRVHVPGSMRLVAADDRVRILGTGRSAELVLRGPLFVAAAPRVLRRDWAPAYGATADGWVIEAGVSGSGGSPSWGGWLLAWAPVQQAAVLQAGDSVVMAAAIGDRRLLVGWDGRGISLVSTSADGTNAEVVNPDRLQEMAKEDRVMSSEAPVAACWESIGALLTGARSAEGREQ